MTGLEHYLVLSAILFCIGLFGALAKANAIVVLMSIEIMLQGVNIALVAFSRFVAGGVVGQTFALFVITVSAAEVAVGLALIIAIYRLKETVDVGKIDEMKG